MDYEYLEMGSPVSCPFVDFAYTVKPVLSSHPREAQKVAA